MGDAGTAESAGSSIAIDEPPKIKVERLDTRVKTALGAFRKEIEKTSVDVAGENYDFIENVVSDPAIKSALEREGRNVKIVGANLLWPYLGSVQDGAETNPLFAGLSATHDGLKINLTTTKGRTHSTHSLPRTAIQEDWDKGERRWVNRLAGMSKAEILSKFEKGLK